MHRSTRPTPIKPQVIQDLGRQLSALNDLQLPPESLKAVRLLQLQRLARRIETIIPGHFGHGERTAHYALLLAEHMGFTGEQRLDLHYAALLHDIGLLMMPDHLLGTATPHTLNDYALIQSHPREGAALLSEYPFLQEPARLIAHHHERWDGAGYPYGLRGDYIPGSARILAIADVFDSIASRTHSWDIALRALRVSAGSQFDPTFCATFYDLIHNHDHYRAHHVPNAVNAAMRSDLAVEHSTPCI
ncbi:MAG: HD-GYP domain-containing protein [Nitrospira sp.]|nr:MAG: HD-GYP domain-containing protein [Nitrospira sp.]